MPLRLLAIGIALVALALALWLLVAAVRRRRWTSLVQVVPALGLLALVALLVPYIFGLNAPHPFFNRPAAVPAGTIVYYRYDPNSISNGANASVTLYAVDGQTGKTLWQRLLGGFDTAVIGGGSVVYAAYTLSSDPSDGVHVHVLALEGATGSVLWQRTLPGLYVPYGSQLAGGTLFLGIAGYGPSRDVYVVALRASDGTQLWALPVSTDLNILRLLASPGILYVQPTASVLQARRPTDGELLWTHSGIQGIAVAGPDAVYTLSASGSVTAYRAQTGAQLWQYGTNDVFHAGVFSGDTLYVTAQHSGPTTDASGHVTNPETLYALDAATGQVRWTFATQYAAPGSLAAGPGVVNVIAGGIYALRSSDGTLLWHTDPHIDGGVATTGPVVGSIVYVTAVQDLPPETLNSSLFGPVYGQTYLYALNTADGAADWGVPVGPVFRIPSGFRVT